MVEVAVVNASPLIFLARAKLLFLLRLTGDVALVAQPVAAELAARGPADPAAQALAAEPWLRVVPGPDPPPSVLAWGLGAGESAVIALALTTSGAVAVLDDLAGRRCAATLGLPVRGTLGLVLAAKRRGTIPAARPVLEALLQGGMYLSRPVLDQALRLVGE